MDTILSPFMFILGHILKYIDVVVYAISSQHNMGICIIIFTFVVNILMFPLTMKQQKTAKLTSMVSPEIKAIQNKYKGKKDSDSMQKQQAETQLIYSKYGINPLGGCLPLLIQMPILFSLFRVISTTNIVKYVPQFTGASTMFLGMYLTQSPTNPVTGGLDRTILIPILAMVTQFVSTKIMTYGQPVQDVPGADTMKMMNNFMPLMSGFFCFSMGTGVGIYWITGNVFRSVQAAFVNHHFSKIDMDELVEKNRDKHLAKTKKREVMNQRVAEYSTKKTSTIAKTSVKDTSSINRDVKVNKDIKPGSISGIANMLSNSKKDDNK